MSALIAKNAIVMIAQCGDIDLKFPAIVVDGDLLSAAEIDEIVPVAPSSLVTDEVMTRLAVVACVDGEKTGFDRDYLDAIIERGGIVASISTVGSNVDLATARFRHDFIVRLSSGLIVEAEALKDAAVVTLRGPAPPPGERLRVSIWTNLYLKPLATGLHPLCVDGALNGGDRVIARSEPFEADRALAAALAGRLLEVETAFIAEAAKNYLLEEASTQGGGQRRESIEASRGRHEWKLASDPSATQDRLGLYDRRTDDRVILEARRGAAFFEAYFPDERAADFPGAVQRLNSHVSAGGAEERPFDVSIIIPVYGQLAFTLNCLDSLLQHRSRRRFEIIVIDDCSRDEVTAQFLPLVSGISYYRQPKNGGFIKSCNIGGSYADGEYIVMLNNDTRVPEHWLDALIDSFATLPNPGLIGSKMLYPDGTLQEGGGILWRNGDAWNYGRNDDPNRPQYCFAREVDYISGCSLALRTSDWRALGGFDPHYAPAYAEDADLCQRVQEAGKGVWYQPASRVIHYEGKTSGTSTTGGVKSYQLLNLKKLFYRWRRRFENHRPSGQDVYLEKERGVRRRLLIIDSVTPTPDQDAGSVQTFLAIKSAQVLGYKVHFVPEDNWLYEPGYTDAMMSMGVECAYAPYELGLEAYLRTYGSLFDVVIVYRAGVLAKSIAALTALTDAVIIFHVADLHYLRMRRQAELDQSEEGLLAAETMKKLEFDLISQADCTVTHSTFEVETIRSEDEDAPVVCWPLMMETVGTQASFDDRRDICFLGGYRHPPNIDAVESFLAEIFPLVRSLIPGVRLHIAGSHMPAAIKDLASDDVVIVGHVENLSDLFDTMRCFVCPLRVGAGAKGKVVSAMAHGLPVVSTAIGVEGTGFVDGVDVLIADDVAAFADKICRVYTNEALWTTLSTNGLRIVEEEFSPHAGAHLLEAAIAAGLRRKLGLPLAS